MQALRPLPILILPLCAVALSSIRAASETTATSPIPATQPTAPSLDEVFRLLEDSHFEQAEPLLARLAADGNAHAQCLHALTLLTGAGPRIDWDEARAELRRAAIANHRLAAQFLLGLVHQPTAAETATWKALAGRPPVATERIPSTLCVTVAGSAPELCFFDSHLWNLDRARRGDATACYNIARMHQIGAGVGRNAAEYRRWLAKAGDAGLAAALEEMATNATLGLFGETADDTRAAALQLRAAEAGAASAQYRLATDTLDRAHTPAGEIAQAVAWLERAASQDHLKAIEKLGDLLRDGETVPRDDQRAIVLYERATGLGSASARSSLGWMYEVGRGVPRDAAHAATLYREAAEAGDVWAMKALGTLHRDGTGVPQDFAEARVWFRRAADHDSASAMNALAWLHAEGRGGPKDDQTAFEWFDQAARAGHDDSQNTLGWRLLLGQGVTSDRDEAVLWFKLAAAQGNRRAMHNLVTVYSGRFGQPFDRAALRHWRLKLAEGQGSIERIDYLGWASALEYDGEIARAAFAELTGFTRDQPPEIVARARAAQAETLLWAILPSLRSAEEGIRLARELHDGGDKRGTGLLARALFIGLPGTPRNLPEARRLFTALEVPSIGAEMTRWAVDLSERNAEPGVTSLVCELLQIAYDNGDPRAAELKAAFEAIRAREVAPLAEREILVRLGSLPHRGTDCPPQAVYQPAPTTPSVLRRDGIALTATIEAEVSPIGEVLDSKVIEASNELYGLAAQHALSRWRFAPALKHGKAVSLRIRVPFSTTPEEPPRSAASDNEPTEPSVPWRTDHPAAVEEAKRSNRPLFLLFTGSDWCPPCKRLEKEILSTPGFAAFATESLVPVFLDFPRRKELPAALRRQNVELAERYGVTAYPTVLITTPEGQVLGKLGYNEGGPKSYQRAIRRFLRARDTDQPTAAPQSTPRS